MAETREVVRHDVEINARAAIDQLREMSRSAESAEEAIAKFSSFLVTNSKKWNYPVQKLREEFRLLNAELAKSKNQTLFGNFGNNKIFSGEKVFTDAAQAAGRFQVAQNGVVTSVNRGTKAYDEADRSARGYKHGIDVVRTALGTLTAVGIFQFLNLVTEAFQKSVESARQLELAIYNLNNAERILSEQGIEISTQDLKDVAASVKELVPTFSRVDVTNAVAGIALFTKDLKLSKSQIEELSKSIAVLTVRNRAFGLSFEQVRSQVLTGLLTGRAQGIRDLGVSVSETTIQAEALRLGLVATKEEFNNLTGEVEAQIKAQALLSVITKSTADEMQNLGEYLDTNDAKIESMKAAWEDLLASLGALTNTAIPNLTQLINIFEYGIKAIKFITAEFKAATAAAKLFFASIEIFNPQKTIENIKKIPQAFRDIFSKELQKLFPEGIPSELKEGSPLRKIFEEAFRDTDVDTPTNPLAGMANGAADEGAKVADAISESEEKIQDIMLDARDKRMDIDENYRRKIEDANRDHAEKMADIARDAARKQEDAVRNYNQKVEDINRDAAQKTAEAQQDARQDEIDREKEFQNKLRELREQFLFDLEDALRERDARQVLRLIREYNMDKKNLEEKRKLERNEAKRNLAQKLADIEQERVLKLEAARRELAEKQAEIALWQQREIADAKLALQRKLQDARTWQQRELAEYRQYLQRKLQDLAAAIVKEYQLTAAGAQSIYNLLNGYFGAGGAIGGMMNGFNNQLSSSLNNILTSSTSGGSQPTVSPTWNTPGRYMAEGGTMIATRPTRAVFGERGPEMATFTPLGRTGQDVNKVFGSGLGSGSDSMINLRISLESGLIANIVDASLDNVAATIEKIRREK